jgi:hypothetical protein
MDSETRKILARLRGPASGDKDQALEYFTQLRERLKSGLRRVMEIPRKHPHFVAALIMAVGCEAVAKLLSGLDGEKRDDHDVFVRELVLPHKTMSAAMGRDLFYSIRHGIAHAFYPKPIILRDGRWVHPTLVWGKGAPHLHLRREGPAIWLSLPTMQRDFELMLDGHRETIRQSSKPGRRLSDQWLLGSILHLASKDSDPGWQAFLRGEEEIDGSTR